MVQIHMLYVIIVRSNNGSVDTENDGHFRRLLRAMWWYYGRTYEVQWRLTAFSGIDKKADDKIAS